jgi:hypothetical protein
VQARAHFFIFFSFALLLCGSFLLYWQVPAVLSLFCYLVGTFGGARCGVRLCSFLAGGFYPPPFCFVH